MIRHWTFGAALGAVCLATTPAAFAETRMSVASGVEFSIGSYGGRDDTTVVSMPLTGEIFNNRWSARLSVPYLAVNGQADVLEGTDDGAGNPIVREGSADGFGDTTLSVTRTFRRLGGSRAYLGISARAVLPTGDEMQGLGTGANDYGLTAEVGTSNRRRGGSILVGRRFLGNSERFDRQDGWQSSMSGWIRAGERGRIGGRVSWREASVEGQDDPSDIGVFVNYRITDKVRLNFSAGQGLSDASPDFFTGIRFTYRSEEFGGA